LTDIRSLLWILSRQEAADRARVLDSLSATDRRALAEDWESQALTGQIAPGGEWRTWLLMAGRGFGKTRAGAEWVLEKARSNAKARIALIGASLDEVAKVMVEGESGLLASARLHEHLRWRPTTGKLRFPSGALAIAYSGASPARLRGPQHHFAWADELAKWAKPKEAWDNMQLGLRLGERPQAVVTTTPGPTPLLRRILDHSETRKTGGRTFDNPYLPSAFVEAVTADYGGTRLGRQELDGELLGEAEGALWTRELIEERRCAMPDRDALGRVLVAVDPPGSAGGDACGIVVGGLCGGKGLVLADCSVSGLRPEGWARRVAAAAESWAADRVIAEANNGGEMVDAVLKTVAPALPLRLVHAGRGKGARAEPVAAAFEAGRCLLAGCFPELEDELCALTAHGFVGGGSPDRADAMVWALSELVLTAPGVPRVRRI
jgi:phage terminase large subunit-like protein